MSKAAGAIRITVIVVACSAVPSVLAGVLLGGEWVGLALLAALSLLVLAALGGRAIAYRVLLPFAVLVGLAVAVSGSALLAALLMCAAAAARGMLHTRGLIKAATPGVIALGFTVTQPPQASSLAAGAITAALVAGLAGLVALVVMTVTRLPTMESRLESHTVAEATTFAVVSALSVGVVTWVAVWFDLAHAGAWLILSVFVMQQPTVKDTVPKILARAAGTLGGFAIAMVVALVAEQFAAAVPIEVAIGAVAAVASTALLLTHAAYWKYALLLTAAIVLLEGAGSNVVETGLTRLAATMAGAGFVFAVAVVLHLTHHHVTHRRLSKGEPRQRSVSAP